MSGPPGYGYPPQQPWGGPNNPYQRQPGDPQDQSEQPTQVSPQLPAPYRPSVPQPQPFPQPDQAQGGQIQPAQMYGYPPPRPIPPPNPAPPLKSQRRRRILAVVGGVVVVALVAGGAVWFVKGRGKDDQPRRHDTHGVVAWQAPVPAFSGDKKLVPGTWFTGKVLAKTEIGAVTGYDLDSGARQWRVPLPGPVCAAATAANGDRTAVLYRTGDSCTHVMGLDLAEGKVLWNRALPRSEYRDGKPIKEAQVAVSANIAAVTWGEGTKGFRLSDGRPQWGRTSGRDCSSTGFAGGDRLVEVNWCKERLRTKQGEPRREKLRYYVRGRSPVTGNALWKWEAPDRVQVEAVLSTAPVVLGTSSGDSVGPTELLTLDAKGEPGVEIDLGKNDDPSATNPTAYNTGCFLGLESCTHLLVTKTAVYLPTNDRPASGGAGQHTNQIVAVDLATGAQRWKQTADPTRPGLPVGTADGDPIVYLPATGKQGGRLLRFDAGTGKTSLYQQNPDQGGTTESQSAASARMYLHDGRFFLVHETLDDTVDKLITAYK
jgi:outer membrane protein assembly factor BamB